MKRIVLTLPGAMPLPAVEGGATETLLDILMEENEKRKKAEFIVFSIYNKKAKEKSLEFKNSKVIYIKTSLFTRKVYGAIRKNFSKFSKKNSYCNSLYYHKMYKKIKKMDLDYLVSQGGDYNYYSKINNVKKEAKFRHIHSHQIIDANMDSSIGNIIGVSKYVTDEWLRCSNNKSLKSNVVYNCIREENFSKVASLQQKKAIREKFGFNEDDFVVLYCGRIIDVKGVKELMQAMEKINNKKIRLLLIGSPSFGKTTISSYLTDIEQMVKNNCEKIQFTGYIPNEELFQYYQAADIQVVPSLWEEAAGMVAIEGMLSGLPLIVTRSGGMTEYIDEKCATIIEKDENVVDNIKNAIVHLYDNPELCNQMSEHGKQRAKLFTKKRFYDEFIKSVLGE